MGFEIWAGEMWAGEICGCKMHVDNYMWSIIRDAETYTETDVKAN